MSASWHNGRWARTPTQCNCRRQSSEPSVTLQRGNEVLSFGYYSNADSRGAGSAVPEPEIPLGWPIAVSVGGVRSFKSLNI